MGFLSDGKLKENEFAGLFDNVSFSNKNADITEHWDLMINGYKVDVKGLKKINRSAAYTNEQFHFIELKNVNGKLGWVYGDADFFAFETNDYWVIVLKNDLQELIKNKVSKTQVFNVDECLYCFYSRSGRRDAMTMVKTIDLMAIATEIKWKNSEHCIKHIIGYDIDQEKYAIRRRTEALLQAQLNKK